MGQGQFRGGVMTPGQVEATEATITLYPDHIEAQTIAGEEHKLPYTHMVLEASDTASGVVVCRDTASGLAVVCGKPGFMRALTKYAGRSVRQALAPNSKRVVRQQAMRIILGVCAVLAAIFVLWGTPRWVRYGLRSVAQVAPLDVDARLGEAWLKKLDLGGPVVTNDPAQSVLHTLVTRLAPHPSPHFTVIVIDAPELDAFSLPGGPLIFKTGLLHRLSDPTLLAGLVAHEMAHVNKRHLMQRISQTLGIPTTLHFFFGDVDAVLRTPASQLQRDTLLRPEDETEADRLALELLTQAHLDPASMEALLVALQADVDAKTPVPWLRASPPLAARLKDLRRHLKR